MIYPAAASATVVVPSFMGARMLTVIADETAPTRYACELGLDAGQRLVLVDDGAAVVDADGNTVHQITAAWGWAAVRCIMGT